MEQNQNVDCCFIRNKNWFRYRVAAIIIENDCVLMASNETADYFYSVGGGVHLGETAEEAIVREVFEETGIKYEIDRLAFIHENFFSDSGGMLKGLVCHEIAFYFIMKSRGTQELNSNSYCPEGKEFMNWVPISNLKNLKAYPTFFVEKLTNLTDTIEHIVTKE
jgi:ADP-ribose pyrophosphatase YjhB (NUDIX family)